MYYKAIIVDDERRAAQSLQLMINSCCDNISVVGLAHSIGDAEALIEQHQPDLLFLDIRMPGGSGFELLNRMKNIFSGNVIFTTAHNHYAIEAFQHHAIGYLLKPIDPDSLIETVTYALKKTASEKKESGNVLLQHYKTASGVKKIPAYETDKISFLDIPDVVRLQSDRNYTTIYLRSGRKIVVSRSLKEYEDLLSQHPCFFRTHKSHLVNLDFADHYIKGEGGTLVLKDKTIIPVSRDSKKRLLELLS